MEPPRPPFGTPHVQRVGRAQAYRFSGFRGRGKNGPHACGRDGPSAANAGSYQDFLLDEVARYLSTTDACAGAGSVDVQKTIVWLPAPVATTGLTLMVITSPAAP